MSKHLLSSYKNEIFFEAALQDFQADTIVLLPGFPSSNNMKEKIKFFSDLGYHVISPRYPGSFQSDGEFLKNNIVIDLIKFITSIDDNIITNLWDLKDYKFKTKNKIIVAESFAGAISCGILANSNNISNLILFSPVWDFEKHNQDNNEEDLEHLIHFVKRAYKNLYRFSFNSLVEELKKIEEIKFKNYYQKIKTPILVFHDNEDRIVSINHSNFINNKIDIKLINEKFGHGMSINSLEIFKEEIKKFLKSSNS